MADHGLLIRGHLGHEDQEGDQVTLHKRGLLLHLNPLAHLGPLKQAEVGFVLFEDMSISEERMKNFEDSNKNEREIEKRKKKRKEEVPGNGVGLKEESLFFLGLEEEGLLQVKGGL